MLDISSGETAFFRLLPILPHSRVTRFAVEREARFLVAVDLARLDVDPALVLERGGLDVALVVQAAERLDRGQTWPRS